MTDGVARLAELFTRSHRPVVFTGAGVSTESGRPDFRHAGATLAIVNLSPTPQDDQADLVIRGTAGDATAAALTELGARV